MTEYSIFGLYNYVKAYIIDKLVILRRNSYKGVNLGFKF